MREDQKMRSYAVIPPLMFDKQQRRLIFRNENGALPDMECEFKARQNVNIWTSGEKDIFKEKFVQHPKNFGAIASCLDRKSAQVSFLIRIFDSLNTNNFFLSSRIVCDITTSVKSKKIINNC